MSENSLDVGAWSSSSYTHSSGHSQYRSTIEILSMNPHNDLISFLAVAQYYEIDFVSLTWEKGRGKVGLGATSEIWQSGASRRVDFAFKRTKLAERYLVASQDEEKAFNALVSEISVLRHPLIQYHQNIVNLEGICWEVPPRSERVWPVLILEKAQLGDLESFMFSEEGRATAIHERLGLCSDIANAIIALHSNDMSHGDLKPANALVFRDGAGETYAKLADFGYAGWAIGNAENVLVYPPKSWPWNAPEHHHRGFTVSAAKKLDVYSFGLICLWLLFFDKPSCEDTVADKECSRRWPLGDFELLDRMKHKDTLKGFARFQVESMRSLSANQKADLVQFFLSAIAYDSNERARNLEDLVILLGHTWQPGPSSLDAEQRGIDHTRVEFGIAQSFYPLMKQHLRVQNCIFTCICHRAEGSSPGQCHANDAFQIAFCYKTGFGTPANERLTLQWLKNAQRGTQDLEKEINLARGTMNKAYYRNGELQTLSSEGLLHESMSTIQYEGDELGKAEADYCRVLQDIERVFGQWNCCVIALKQTQISVLQAARKFKEADVLRIGLLRDFKNDPGYYQISSDLDTRSINEMIEQGRWRRLEERPNGPPLIFMEPPAASPLLLETTKSQEGHAAIDSILNCFNERMPETTDLLWSLANSYTEQGRYSEAESILLHLTKFRVEFVGQSHPLTLFLASQLATVYGLMGLWSKAENIYLHISRIQAHILGEHHRQTLTTRANLASIYGQQSRLSEAEQLISQVLATQRSVLGELDSSTLTSMGFLAVIYSDQGRIQTSLEVKYQLLDKLTRVNGSDHSEILYAMNLICVDLARLGRWSEVKMMAVRVLERTKAISEPENPKTLIAINNLAAAHYHEGLLQESETEFMHVLQARRRLFGETHPESVESRLNLAVVIRTQGRLAEAESLIVKALESCDGHLGEGAEIRLRATIDLARIYVDQSRLEEAENLILRVIALGQDSLGEKHPDYLYYESDLAELRYEQKRFEEAGDIGSRVLKGRIDVLGEDHPHTISGRVRLARYFYKQRRWEESDALFTKVIEQRRELKGDEHDDTLRAMQFLASSLWSQGRWREAIAGFYRSSRIVRAIGRFCRPLVWNTSYSLLLPGVLAISVITYKWRQCAFRPGLGLQVTTGAIPSTYT